MQFARRQADPESESLEILLGLNGLESERFRVLRGVNEPRLQSVRVDLRVLRGLVEPEHKRWLVLRELIEPETESCRCCTANENLPILILRPTMFLGSLFWERSCTRTSWTRIEELNTCTPKTNRTTVGKPSSYTRASWSLRQTKLLRSDFRSWRQLLGLLDLLFKTMTGTGVL